MHGPHMIANCLMPVWIPQPQQIRWWKFNYRGNMVLKMAMPAVSQRNGTICCHRYELINT